jgi:hypothetical protein
LANRSAIAHLEFGPLGQFESKRLDRQVAKLRLQFLGRPASECLLSMRHRLLRGGKTRLTTIALR